MLDLLKTPLFILKVRQRAAFARAAPALGGVVVDVGCGAMPYRSAVDCTRYWGMDFNVSAEEGQDLAGSAEAVPLRDAVADAVVCTEVIEHVREPLKAVTEAARVLKPGGRLYLSAPMSWCLHYEPYDYFRFTSHGLRHLLERAGLSLEREERIGGLFSLAAVRLVDVAAAGLGRLLAPLSRPVAERLAALVVAPLSVLGHVAGALLDRFSPCDAIGWAVLARKAPCASGAGSGAAAGDAVGAASGP